MIHVTCRLTAKDRDQPRNPTLGNRVWATFTFFLFYTNITVSLVQRRSEEQLLEFQRQMPASVEVRKEGSPVSTRASGSVILRH